MVPALCGLAVMTSALGQPAPIDAKATKETKALFANLKKLSKTNILFGHQSATEYGHGWAGDQDRSDVKSVVGSHPAVVGLDFGGLSLRPRNEIEASKAKLRKLITESYDSGGVVTVCMHMSNPVTGGNFYAKQGDPNTVKELLPGGTHHEQMQSIFADIADLAKSCRGKDGKLAPIIFRPWHEFDGEWFWWGASHCTVKEFTDLYKMTVTSLRDRLGVHNILYAFSPDCRFTTEAQFLARYPGDAFVDMVGMDDYADFGRDKYDLATGVKKLRVISDFAKARGKLAAFTETGLESIPNPTWYTETLLKALKSPGLELSYVLVWRNDQTSATHYYAPFPGHSSVPDFKKFYDDPFTLFEKDLKSIYR